MGEPLYVLRRETALVGSASAQHGTGYDVRMVKGTFRGLPFWTREGFRPRGGMETFTISANARIGYREGTSKPKELVLHLAADPRLDWDELARAVTEADALHRECVRHNRWTPRIADLELDKAMRRRREISPTDFDCACGAQPEAVCFCCYAGVCLVHVQFDPRPGPVTALCVGCRRRVDDALKKGKP